MHHYHHFIPTFFLSQAQFSGITTFLRKSNEIFDFWKFNVEHLSATLVVRLSFCFPFSTYYIINLVTFF